MEKELNYLKFNIQLLVEPFGDWYLADWTTRDYNMGICEELSKWVMFFFLF